MSGTTTGYIKDILEPGNNDILEAMVAKQNGNASDIQKFLAGSFDDELINHPSLSETLSSGRGLIQIVVNASSSKFGAANTIGHEVGAHAVDIAVNGLGAEDITPERVDQQHIQFRGSADVNVIKGSEQDILQKQLIQLKEEERQ